MLYEAILSDEVVIANHFKTSVLMPDVDGLCINLLTELCVRAMQDDVLYLFFS